jgi:predicted GIY-YIG superfamily endonuclease
MPFWVYMLRCADSSYYIGHTDDLNRRVAQHDAACFPDCYTATRLPVRLVYSSEFATRAEALASERQLKGWSRKKKEALIRGDWGKISRLAKSSADHALGREVEARPSTSSGRTTGSGQTNGTLSLSKSQTKRIHGQDSFLLRSNHIELAITKLGGMLGPVTFFPDSPAPISPYHVAPWAEEPLPSDTPPMLRALRGDWFCSAFGENAEHCCGRQLPAHGETANGTWQYIDATQAEEGAYLRLGMDLPLQGGHCENTTALRANHSVIYQRHDLSGLTGSINPGHHATLQFPAAEGAGRLSFSPLAYAHSHSDFIDGPMSQHYSCIRPSTLITDLHSVPIVGGMRTDLTRYPARCGFDDIIILCADPSLNFAWSAVTFHEHACPRSGNPSGGYVWFALRDPKQLASTLLWFSNGGRHFPPWNSRHINVMGIEDITAFFHVGLAASCRTNALTERGIRTCLHPDADGTLSIRYIQGVARIPQGFDRVALIEPVARVDKLLLVAESGAIAEVACEIDFLRTGKLGRLSA